MDDRQIQTGCGTVPSSNPVSPSAPKVLGLTGGVGMGKSAAARLLEDLGLRVIDTDRLARQIVEPGQPALREIQEAFGTGIVDAQGRLRRDHLAGIVFSDVAARKKLETIMHPRIRELWRAQVAQWRARQTVCGVVVIPLLFETGAESEFDATVCVACSAPTQRSRLKERGWTDGQIEQRLAAQWPVGKKIMAANFVIWNEGSLAVMAGQVERILKRENVRRP